MLTWMERIITVGAVLTAVEVGVLCLVLGGGSDLTKAERASLSKRITVMTEDAGRAALAEKLRHWDAYVPKGPIPSAPGTAGGKGAGKGGKGSRNGEKGKEEDGDEEADITPRDIAEAGAIALTDSSRRWEYREIPRELRDALVPDLRSGVELLQQAASKLVTLEDGSQAYQITGIQAGSIIADGGFAPGDIIISVNGQPVSGHQDALRLYNELRNETKFVVVVQRGGEMKTLYYDLN